ncbi:T9SS type A sorting domain-containing protein [Flavobacterium lacustre]|uniref:T9SS type A sorting domain-containing protein n=1 Tax=Flavobacterium lacustre TaxID=3016339 RepID=UPI0022B748BB|nr:T9SS type A sorting domain-containing protein [Flavobacterium lacustre]
MVSFSRYILIVLLIATSIGYSQTKGLIYKPAGDALGKSVLDPNGDGYTSLTTAGFSGTDYGSASELNMVPLPIIGAEPTGDLTTGGSGGATDIVSVGENSNQSCYILYKTVGGIDYLIIRFRLGSASTAAKGYSLLMDTDGTFGSQYTDPKNPGYEREIVLNTGSSNAVVVNTFSGLAGGITSAVNFSNENYTQRSIALTTVSGDSDYFYDFFIPYSALGLTTQPVRIAAATISSAGSGITGTKSDYNGVNDKLYGNNSTAIANALISTFPATSLTSLTSGTSFANPITLSPVVNSGVTASSTSISGTSTETNGTVITIYKNGTSIGTTTVTSNSWTLTSVSGLAAGNIITAKAQAVGKDLSLVSNSITVNVAAICFTPAPTNLVRTNGSQVVTGSWSPVNGTITASTVQIRLWEQSATNTFNELPSSVSVYVATNGTWSFTVTTTQSTFNGMNVYATATYNGCSSAYSNVAMKTSGSGSTKTVKPTMVTSTILASPTVARTVQVTNVDTSASYLILYINGYEVARTTSTIASNASYDFSYTGFVEGDVVVARAQSASASYLLSDISTSVTVSITSSPSTAPVISGTYIAGSGKTVTGTSTESAGTVIYLYKGATLLGSTTVDAYGNWSISGLTLTAADVLTATAKATGETISSSSNSITVAASAPAAPTVSGTSYQAGASSISGTGGLGSGNTLTIYVDGSPIGTILNAPASWTLSGIASGQLYKGAVITATNTNVSTGVESGLSNSVPVVGVASFCITDTSGNLITAKRSGETFNIKITAMDGANCSGSVFTGFNGTVVLSSSTNMLLGAGTTAVFVNGVLASHSIALGAPGTGITLSAINSNDPSTKGIATLDVTAAIWKGTTSTDFNTASNWTGSFVPVSGADISFDSLADNDCYLDQNRTVTNINFNSTTKKLNVNGKTLTINGAISGNGSSSGLLTGSDSSSLVFTGTGNAGTIYMDQTTLGTSNVLENLTLNRTSSGSVTLGNALSLSGVLTVTAGTFNTGDQITFKSDVNSTAIVGPVTGVINGKVTVERFIPGRRAFRFLSSAVTTTTSILANWQEGVNNNTTTTNNNPNPGFGTHITGSVSGANGFDATQTTNASMYAFNNSSGAWVTVLNTDVTTLESGFPYRLLVRGDRSTNLNTNTPALTNTVLRATGTLYTGTKVITDLNSNAGGYNFIGNPYQSPVDMNQVLQASTNLNKVFYYIWDPTLNLRGGYVSVDVGTGDKVPNTSSATKYLQPWQGCFVKTDVAGSPSLSFQEAYKQVSTANVNVFRKADVTSSLRLELYEANAFLTSGKSADALLIQFGSENSNEVNSNDANKFTNLDENFATKNNTTLLSIERRALPQAEEIVPLHVNQYRNANYTIVAEASNIEGVTPFLLDNFTQTYTEIPATGVVTYNYSVLSSDAQSVSSSRFNIVFKASSTLDIKSNELESGLKLYPNLVKDGWFMMSSSSDIQNIEIEIFNVLGQKIPFKTTNIDANTLKIEPSKSSAKGVYWVKMKQEGRISTQKIIVN